MGKFCFRYDAEFLPRENPRGTYEWFTEAIRAFFVANGLNYGMGALGGSRHCYGDVQGDDREALERVRQELAEWMKRQPVRCTARLGEIEDTDTSNIVAPITHWVFTVDNLTKSECPNTDHP